MLRDRRKVGELPAGSSEDAVYELIAATRACLTHSTSRAARRSCATAWPGRCVTLVLLLALNAAFNPSFLHIEWRDGHLYGSLIDILNRAAPLMLVSLGMTLVIATRGIDISVGAVVAIAAALAAWMIGGSLVVKDGAQPVSRFPMSAGDRRRRWRSRWLCGLWNGLLVARVGMQPIIATLILMVAGRGIAQLITGGQIITIYYAPYLLHRQRLPAGPAVLAVHRGGGVRRCCTWRSRAPRWACSSRRWASTRRRRAWPACRRGG